MSTTNSNQVTAGMTIALEGQIYRVESAVKVAVPKGTSLVKTKLRNLLTEELKEKSFKASQSIEEVSLLERKLEYLYLEERGYLFLDVGSLDQLVVPAPVIGEKVSYLKEGVEVKANLYGEVVVSIELPQFLELQISKISSTEGRNPVANASRLATLETGAKVEVPAFIESGDIIKVDTQNNEYVQRV